MNKEFNFKKRRRVSLSSDGDVEHLSSVDRLHKALDCHSLLDLKAAVEDIKTKLLRTTSAEDTEMFVKVIFRAEHHRVSADGSTYGKYLVHTWAHDRYDDEDKFYSEGENLFLREEGFDPKEDAVDTLQFLLENDANIHERASDGQTVLHMAMANGRMNVLEALLESEHVNFTVDDFKLLNKPII